jgi:hypothetical protein
MSSAETRSVTTVEELSAAELRRLLGRAVSRYAQLTATGTEATSPFPADATPSPTEVAVTVCAMLEQAGIEVFELGLWNAWGTGSSATPHRGGRS